MNLAGLFTLTDRALRSQSRSVLHHLLRFGLVLLVWLLLAFAQLISLQAGAPGLYFLAPVVYVTLAVLGLLGLTWFGTAITEEKESGTLPLLRMTGMGGIAILLGKLAGRLGAVVTFLALQLPFAMLAVALGGLTHAQVLAVYLVLLGYAVFLAGFGLLASSFFRRSLTAVLVAFVFHIGYLILAPIAVAASWTGGGNFCDHPLLAVHPYSALGDVFSPAFDGSFAHWYLWGNLILGAVCLCAAWPIFALVGDRETDRREIGLRVGIGRRSGSSRVWSRAFLWKDWIVIGRGWFGYALRLGVALTVIAAIIGLILLVSGGRAVVDLPEIFLGTTLGVCYGLTVVGIGFELAHSFAVERRWGTFPDLMVIPVRPRRHYWGKVGCVFLMNLVYPLLGAAVMLAMVLLQLFADTGADLPGDWRYVDEVAEGFLRVFFGNGFIYFPHAMTLVFWSLCPFFGVLLRWGGFVISLTASAVLMLILGMVGQVAMAFLFFAASFRGIEPELIGVVVGVVSMGAGFGLAFLFQRLTVKLMNRLCSE